MTYFRGLMLALFTALLGLLLVVPALATESGDFFPDPSEIQMNEAVGEGVSNLSSGTIEFLYETLPWPLLAAFVIMLVATVAMLATGNLVKVKTMVGSTAFLGLATFAFWNPSVSLPFLDSVAGIFT